MSDCIFCKIVAGELSGEILYQDDLVAVFRDVNPKGPVHILIIPTKHIKSVADTSPDDKMLLGELIYRAKIMAEQLGVAENGFRLIINNGRDAGQTVDHIHVHLIGGRSMTWPPG